MYRCGLWFTGHSGRQQKLDMDPRKIHRGGSFLHRCSLLQIPSFEVFYCKKKNIKIQFFPKMLKILIKFQCFPKMFPMLFEKNLFPKLFEINPKMFRSFPCSFFPQPGSPETSRPGLFGVLLVAGVMLLATTVSLVMDLKPWIY